MKALTRFLEMTLSTAQAGLVFSKDHFDIDRFRALQSAAAEFMAAHADATTEQVLDWINLDRDYPTPKLDVRALILDERQHILLVREAADGLWTLPGGWCDLNESPADAVVREVMEETGLAVHASRLLALLDKHKHPHPPQIPHALKAFFLCTNPEGTLRQKTNETLAAGYFSPRELLPLSEHRVLASQIEMLHRRVIEGNVETIFD